MKIKNLIRLLFVFATLSILLPSCDKKNCTKIYCGVNQQCIQGQCYCADGYEGANCATQSALNYVGDYNVYESCNGAVSTNPNYNVHISLDLNSYKQIDIANFLNSANPLIALIRTGNDNRGSTLYIPTQNVGAFQDVSGQGTFDPATKRLTIQIAYTANFQSYDCTETFYPR